MTDAAFPATRQAGLQRLEQFAPRAGRAYAAGRNIDPGPDSRGAVSKLSPYLRHRLITEEEVIARVLADHDPVSAEKYVQEVVWRTYWKGWLEMRPGVWTRFLAERDRAARDHAGDTALAQAEAGRTGIEGFDDWARELAATGYLHNHARMWFASIWIFTLRLPWTLGADLFLRRLIDADPASNTLSWRWVAGLQTPGKTYLATAENIALCTDGRFSPRGLADHATALTEAPVEPPTPLPTLPAHEAGRPALLLLTSEDLHPESLFGGAAGSFRAVRVAADPALLWGEGARRFVRDAADDAAARAARAFDASAEAVDSLDPDSLAAAAREAGVDRIVTPCAPVGPVADALRALTPALQARGVALVQVRRSWDEQFWPHAAKGFFPFKTRVGPLLRARGLPA